MKKIIVLTTATALLSSCGIYTKYQPAETTPDNLYGEEVAVDDTTNFGNVNWRELFTDPIADRGSGSGVNVGKTCFPSFVRTFPARNDQQFRRWESDKDIHAASHSQLGTGHLRTSTQCQATGQSTVCPKQGLPAGCAYPVDRRDRQRILYIVDVR